jgi:hypothetical protein
MVVVMAGLMGLVEGMSEIARSSSVFLVESPALEGFDISNTSHFSTALRPNIANLRVE